MNMVSDNRELVVFAIGIYLIIILSNQTVIYVPFGVAWRRRSLLMSHIHRLSEPYSFTKGAQAPFFHLRRCVWRWPPAPGVFISNSSTASISIVVVRVALATINVGMVF